MPKRSYRIALGGLLSALAIGIMLLGSAVPFATFAVPAIAALAVLYFTVEYGRRFALLVFLAIAFLSLMLVPDKETALIFSLLLGPYPMLKGMIEGMKRKALGFLLKFLLLNTSVALTYWLLLNFFAQQALIDEFLGYTRMMTAGLLLLGNAAFLFYDIALTRLVSLYIYRLKPRLERGR